MKAFVSALVLALAITFVTPAALGQPDLRHMQTKKQPPKKQPQK